VLILGAALRNFERSYNDGFGIDSDGLPASGQDFHFVVNAVWCVIITMTTVGYGDFFAQSDFGMLVTVSIIFWGIFIVSLMVVTLTNSISLDCKETRAYNILFRLKTREELANKAAYMVVTIIRIIALDKDYERKRSNESLSKHELKDIFREYEDIRGEMRSILEIHRMEFMDIKKTLRPGTGDPAEEMRKIINIIEYDFDD
jgi:hypothetical protein